MGILVLIITELTSLVKIIAAPGGNSGGRNERLRKSTEIEKGNIQLEGEKQFT